MYRVLFAYLLFISQFMAFNAYATSENEAEIIPHVNEKAMENYRQYQYAGEHKAFAIAPGGAWAWQADQPSKEVAEKQALYYCEEYTQQTCILYALDNDVVFDQKKWPTLWGPYASKKQAKAASVGPYLGQRFYNLRFKKNDGKTTSLSAFKGKVVFVHFWGSWCPPCLREFPSLKKLQAELQKQLPGQVEMIMLQIREPFEESKQWATKNKFNDMPLYDSGFNEDDADNLTLADGSKIVDRKIARVFPSTYVLDKNGLVIFSNFGRVHDWSEYLGFFEHAVKHGGVAGK